MTSTTLASLTTTPQRRRLGGVSVAAVVISASAPLTVIAGGSVAAYATSGMIGLPWVYLFIGIIMMLFSAGYGAMSRHITNGGAMYAYVARGLGRVPAVGAAFVAAIAYNAIQISVYGFFGGMVADLLAQHGLPDFPWVVPALLCVFIVLIFGVMRIELNARLLAVLLAAECLVVLIFDITAFTNSTAPTVSLEAITPNALGTGSLVAAVCLCVAAYMGIETAALYAEDCERPTRTVARATYFAVAGVVGFYTFSALAMTVAVGPDRVVELAQQHGTQFVFHIGSLTAGSWFGQIAPYLYVTSMFAALLAFHSMVARYLFALGREGVLPKILGRQHAETGAPIMGACTQAVIAGVVISAFHFGGLQPVQNMAVWLAGVGALGILILMGITSIAAIAFFAHRITTESLWSRVIAPALSAITLCALAILVLLNFDVVIGEQSFLSWALPVVVVVALIAGILWGLFLRARRPEIYRRIGLGESSQTRLPGPAGFLTGH